MNLTPDQCENTWSRSALFQERTEAAGIAMKISDLTSEIGRLKQELDERQAQLAGVKSGLNQANRHIEKLNHTLSLRENSISWRITAPLRTIMNAVLRR